MGATKPAMFIGSSVEGKRIAETIQLALEYEVHSTVWHQGVFGLSGGTLESLVAAVNDYDFATLVLTADDLLEKRNVSGRGPRDNVLFELGLFMGALGRNRTFIVHSRTTPPMLPSDLAGITPATYEDRSNLEAALGPACTKIRRAIEGEGTRPRLAKPADDDPAMTRFAAMLSEQNAMLTELFQRLTAKREVTAEDAAANSLDFLEGAWISTPPGSHAYCAVKEGVPYLVYCYGGDSRATGEYYDFRRIGDEIFARFRWFEDEISGSSNDDLRGFAWLKIESPTQLAGAWWMEGDVPARARDNVELLKQSRGMNSYVWKKQDGVAFPRWAFAAFPRWAFAELRRPR